MGERYQDNWSEHWYFFPVASQLQHHNYSAVRGLQAGKLLVHESGVIVVWESIQDELDFQGNNPLECILGVV
jgi:hypothetical protein